MDKDYTTAIPGGVLAAATYERDLARARLEGVLIGALAGGGGVLTYLFAWRGIVWLLAGG